MAYKYALVAVKVMIAATILFSVLPAMAAAPSKASTPAVGPAPVSVAEPPPPADVRIVSMPAPTAADVKIVSVPESSSELSLVHATWWLLSANALLCIVTLIIGINQSQDMRSSIRVSEQAAAAAKVSADAADRSAAAATDSVNVTVRQERTATERAVNRAAHEVMAKAERLVQRARAVPVARTQLHILAGQGGLPPGVREQTEKDLQDKLARLAGMKEAAHTVVAAGFAALADADLTARLFRLDEHLVQLGVMREAIGDELDSYQTENTILRQQKATMQAAVVAGQSSIPPKKTLG